jgi:hypothetical protein
MQQTSYKYFINQPRGVGDLIFCQHLVKTVCGDNHLWPVESLFYDQMVQAYPNINWAHDTGYKDLIKVRRRSKIGNFELLPVRFSDTVMKVRYKDVMRAKYDMFGLDYRDWTKSAQWKRIAAKEKQLKELKTNGNPYILVNTNHGGNKFMNVLINPKTDFEVVQMNFTEGYTMFDWAEIFEDAEEIHTVGTGVLFMLEMLNLKNKVKVYKRANKEPHENHDYLFSPSKFDFI